MAELIDEVLINDLETSSIDEMDKEEVIEAPPEPTLDEAKPVESDLPEKYRGKSLDDIVAMHKEAERLIGRQGSEVGELRKVVDDFIKTQTLKDSKTVETEDVTEDFYDNPRRAVDKVVDNHPAIKEAKEAALNMRRSETLTKLQGEYPDIQDIVKDPAFSEWINASKVRTELYTRAEVNYDYDSAKELLANWQEKKQISKKVAETSKVDRDQQLKAADIGSNGNNETVSKKKYRRSDIIKLMQNDPDRYDSMSNEIMAAYREGRVI